MAHQLQELVVVEQELIQEHQLVMWLEQQEDLVVAEQVLVPFQHQLQQEQLTLVVVEEEQPMVQVLALQVDQV
tara:strand:+ start:309 stop:527 length:219 start_codon:yes stop_codon:yes gene_type:complete